ncbi:hypothetical protein ACHQM5_017005 [Ranunculus cassubicifolius]
MALRRAISQRISHYTKISSSPLNLTQTQTQFSSPSFSKTPFIPPADHSDQQNFPTENGFFRRILQKRALAQSAMSGVDGGGYPSFLFREKLMEKLKGKDGLIPVPFSPEKKQGSESLGGLTVDGAKKLLRVAQLEMLKSTLRKIPTASISYSQFVQICVESSSNREQGLEFAKMLDQSGVVIVLKDSVFLRPEQLAKALEGVISPPTPQANDPRRRELEMLEKKKAVIDKKAEVLVRRELWGGLGFLLFQTVGFVRLTFWELSWDVMEPICFYLTSIYFMASYAFFLRTSTEPSFEGFFQSRFKAKQKRLMRANKFDVERFNELKKVCYPRAFDQSDFSTSASINHSEEDMTRAIHI